ncbi:MAG: hypothetical protein SF002_15695 [Alphaproteobacteria bacterium]|nr:hypothetical protein [Alphaproteobacteria bacterium]
MSLQSGKWIWYFLSIVAASQPSVVLSQADQGALGSRSENLAASIRTKEEYVCIVQSPEQARKTELEEIRKERRAINIEHREFGQPDKLGIPVPVCDSPKRLYLVRLYYRTQFSFALIPGDAKAESVLSSESAVLNPYGSGLGALLLRHPQARSTAEIPSGQLAASVGSRDASTARSTLTFPSPRDAVSGINTLFSGEGSSLQARERSILDREISRNLGKFIDVLESTPSPGGPVGYVFMQGRVVQRVTTAGLEVLSDSIVRAPGVSSEDTIIVLPLFGPSQSGPISNPGLLVFRRGK